VRSALKASTWQGPEEQLSRKFAWSSRPPVNRRCLSRRSLMRVSSLWSGCSHAKPRGSLWNPHGMIGSRIASRTEEAIR
jgi:hypothetical protein